MSQIDHHLAELDKKALEAAYSTYIQQLFLIWMKDKSEQPERMMRGAAQARQAYKEAHAAIEERLKG